MYKDYIEDISEIGAKRISVSLDRFSLIECAINDAATRQKLTLMLGAGVSLPSKLPDWRTVTICDPGVAIAASIERG
jgi:hypothetical protein